MRGRRADEQAGGRAVAWIARFLRQLAGMPDYAAHLEHLRRCHPERGVPSEREFFEDYLRSRYAEGPTRCC
ncbi:MAG: YbdD/YjiX family protein [Gemmatimonadales bacterium]|nr:YbdD/YjiX family protein [Gemmatimonadales bacterium]MBA3553741.1 YbdD/YjiX family protein [Gemmatimonadales bacterium]